MRPANQLIVFLTACSLIGCGDGTAPIYRYESPSGRTGIAIQLVADVKADDPLNEEQVAFVRYSITFTDSLSRPIASIPYHDVYGIDGEPVELADLVRWMNWSPHEDFVILPAEGWITAPGTVSTMAVNLNPRYRWTTSQIALDDQVWIDSLRMIGNEIFDCAYSVAMFDGRTGETKSIKAAESPVGFTISRVEEKAIHIQSQPDNCASEEQRAAFVPQCWAFSLELFALKKEECGATP